MNPQTFEGRVHSGGTEPQVIVTAGMGRPHSVSLKAVIDGLIRNAGLKAGESVRVRIDAGESRRDDSFDQNDGPTSAGGSIPPR